MHMYAYYYIYTHIVQNEVLIFSFFKFSVSLPNQKANPQSDSSVAQS